MILERCNWPDMHGVCAGLVVLFLSLAIPTHAGPSGLTLITFYERALERSERLPIGEAEWRAAEARYERALRTRGPEVRAIADGSLREGRSRSGETAAAGIGASWTLFDGFQSVHEAAARRAEGEAIRFDTARTRQQLYADCAAAYFEWLARDGDVQAVSNDWTLLHARVQALEERVRLGTSPRSDLLAAQARCSGSVLDLVVARTLRDEAWVLLDFLAGPLSEADRPVPPAALPDATAIRSVLDAAPDRPDLQAAAQRIEAARSDLEAGRSLQRARVTADADLFALRHPDGEDRWEIGLRVELPVFDRGLRSAQIAERQETVRVRELHFDALKRMADLEVRRALRAVEGGLAEWAALQDARRDADAYTRQQESDFALGRTIYLDVLAARLQEQALIRRDVLLSMRVHADLARLKVAVGGVMP